MKSLLDQFIPVTTGFRPSTTREVFALRLAQKLGEPSAVRHSVDLAGNYSEGQLLSAYRKTLRVNGHLDLARCFHAEVAQIHGNGYHDHYATLLSIRVERRTIAVAVFHGDHLEYADSRQLSSDNDKAVASAAAFIHWILGRFSVESAALETIVNGHEIQRRALRDAVSAVLRERMLPIWEIPRSVLLESYGQPPLKSRAELREVAVAIWPILAGTHAKVFIQDAALLGLHVQTERLFIIN